MSATDDIVFFSAQTSDATSTSKGFFFPNRRGQLVAWGTFGGGLIAVNFSPDGGATWIPAKDRNGTAIVIADAIALELTAPYGEMLQCIISGSSGASINVKIQVI